MRTAAVILDIPTQALDEPYTYLVPDEMDEAVVGCAVVVPFGGREAIGFIISEREETRESLEERFDVRKLKSLRKVLSRPFFDEDGAACARYLSERYIAPLSSCVRLFTPPGGVPRMVRGTAGWRIEAPAVGEVDDRWVHLGPAAQDFTPRSTAAKQTAIIEALKAGELRVAELTVEFGSVAQTLKSLEAKGVVVVEHRRRMRGREPLTGKGESTEYAFIPTQKPELTEGQARALKVIAAAVAHDDGQVVLVDGVTGSGKTEVYLQAIEAVLREGRTALVLVPEIALTPQTVARFRGRFGDQVAVMHSRMSQGERFDQWDFIRSGRARVVVGARSALFTPLSHLGIIVIDEEHEGSYKQDSAPRYSARDVALWMAQRSGAAVVLGSATPSIESLHACETQERWHHAVLPERANKKPLPDIEVVDMAHEFKGGSRSMFSHRLSKALEETLRAHEKAILLLNQRGYAKFLLCRDCGYVPECPSCSTSLTYHEQGNMLMCHHCGYHIPVPATCPECGSPYLKKFGAGTQRVEAELRALIDTFEGVQADIVRMDADTTKGKGAHRRLLEEFASHDSAVLLGTQMIAKGLDFDDVTLVGVINADTMLKLPDFRSAERTFDLIEQVAGRAGRADLPGRVIVQTYWAGAAAIRAAAAYDRGAFLADELPKREGLHYPPFVRMANVLVWGKDEQAMQAEAVSLSNQLQKLVRDQVGDSWTLLPATPCVLSKLRGTYRWHIVIKCPNGDDLSAVLEPFFRTRKPNKDVPVAVDIDPLSVL